MKTHQKTISVILASLSVTAAHSATTVYFQDFSASNPVHSVNGTPITEGSLVEQDNFSFTGGDVGNQATNGDYIYTMTSPNGATTGNGFIINASAGFQTAGYNGPTTGGVADYMPGAGIANIDEGASFSTGTITLADGATGTVSLALGAFNVGGEFMSLNSVEVTEDVATGEVLMTLGINAFGDFFPINGNEHVGLTTSFSGGDGGFANLSFASSAGNGFEDSAIFQNQVTITGQNQGFDDTEFIFVLREGVAVPEPSSAALLGLAGLAFLGRRSRK